LITMRDRAASAASKAEANGAIPEKEKPGLSQAFPSSDC
jgi:hypothetical protein